VTKRKTKLVFVGWGIVMYLNSPDPYIFPNTVQAETEEEAIKLFNKGEILDSLKYERYFKDGNAIAKKLWVKVKDEFSCT